MVHELYELFIILIVLLTYALSYKITKLVLSTDLGECNVDIALAMKYFHAINSNLLQ